MKTFLVLVVLGVGGWFGYKWMVVEPAVATETETATTNVAPPPASFGAAMEQEASAQGGGEAAAEVADPVDATSTGATALSPELQALLDQADAQWTALSAGDRNPTTEAQAITLAKQYTKVLQGLYQVDDSREQQAQLIAERLQPLADSIFFSPAPYLADDSGFVVNYNVKSGDILDNIGRTYGMSYHFINILRGEKVEDGNIRPGDRLKLFNLKDKGYAMRISKSEFLMDLFVGGIFARRFDIGHGEDITPTPAGTTFITAREREPQWTDPKTNTVYNYGEPGHILGPVWLAFDSKIGRNGLGIHGYTGDGQATGVRASNGCIRMKNDEARLLYNILVPCATINGSFITRAPMKVTIVE